MSNGGAGQWGKILGRWENNGGGGGRGGGGACSSTCEEEGVGAKKKNQKTTNQATVAQFQPVFGVQEMERGSVVSQVFCHGSLKGG